MRRPAKLLCVPALLWVAACGDALTAPADPDAPTDLAYLLQPSGDPGAPAGILLEWSPPRSGRALAYDVYARSSSRETFALRATTTSPSFHDAGIPQRQYFVRALDENSAPLGESNVVTVDERNRLSAPAGLTSITLNGAVELAWAPNAYDAAPALFAFYRVYSSPRSGTSCNAFGWVLEGTTVSDGFVARGLSNGATRCFAVSAISRDGHESAWSNVREDTPRYDARSVVLDAADTRRSSAGFQFMPSGAGGPFGAVVADTFPGVDLVLERRDGALWFRAGRPEVRVAPYSVAPVSGLTSIDRAPAAGYVDAAQAVAGFGYVCRMQYADGVRYAALRVVHVSADYVLFDFAFQTQAGSGELLRIAN